MLGSNRIVLGTLVAGMLLLTATPLPSSALSVDDVQAQIQKLLEQVKELTRQLNELRAQLGQSDSATSTPKIKPTPPHHRVCEVLYRNLIPGVQGDDVRGLQEFLGTEGHFAGNATGYFGPITAEAVAKWQAKEGVPPVGSFGPMSRERIKVWCGGGVNQVLKATPTHGAAPLTVWFHAQLASHTDYYSIDFGDGASEELNVKGPCPPTVGIDYGPGCNNNPETSTQHTYASDGSYTAILYQTTGSGGGCPPGSEQRGCLGGPMTPASRIAIGKAHITVGATACTKEYRPVCGSKPIVCITTPCNTIQQTYGNECMMKADGATFLYAGSCRPDSANPEKDPLCKSWYDGCNSCSRSTPGGPAMCTLKYCTSESMQKPYCSAYFDKVGDPTVSGGCVRAGCSGHACVDKAESGFSTTCEYLPEYACFKNARCERQVNGKCGWTETAELKQCLQNPPSL